MPLSGSGTGSKNKHTPTPECHQKRSGAAAAWPECLFSIHHNRDTCSLVFLFQGAVGKRYQLGWSHARGLMKVGWDLVSLDVNHWYEALSPLGATRETGCKWTSTGGSCHPAEKLMSQRDARAQCKYRLGSLIQYFCASQRDNCVTWSCSHVQLLIYSQDGAISSFTWPVSDLPKCFFSFWEMWESTFRRTFRGIVQLSQCEFIRSSNWLAVKIRTYRTRDKKPLWWREQNLEEVWADGDYYKKTSKRAHFNLVPNQSLLFH